MSTLFTPDPVILRKYADVLIKFALWGGQGVRPGEVVYVEVPDWAKPLYLALQQSVISAGAHPVMSLVATDAIRDFLFFANDDQIKFFPREFRRGLVRTVDHRVHIRPLEGPHELEDVPSAKVLARNASIRPLRQWWNDKEAKGLMSWTLALWGTEDYATEAGMTLEEYWQQIISACYLDDPDPIASWRQTFAEIERVRVKLQVTPIKRLHVTAEGTDLWITLGQQRAWRRGSGRNIPSFEIFTSPDWRGTQGTIAFDQPLFYSGVKIENVRLVFEKGCVVESHADTNLDVLQEMIAQPNADHIGEFSMTDTRFSRITRPMCTTLFDENMGGPFGNTHIALGMAYKDTFDGDPASLKAGDWKRLGFNDPNCAVHTDIIATTDRVVDAEVEGSAQTVTIFKDGKFAI